MLPNCSRRVNFVLIGVVMLALTLGRACMCHSADDTISAKLKEGTSVGMAFKRIRQGFFNVEVTLTRPDDWFIVTNKESTKWVSKSGDTIWNRTSADEESHVWEGVGVTGASWPGVLFAGNLTRHGVGDGDPPGFHASVADIDIDVDSLGLHSDGPTGHWPPNLSYEEDAVKIGDGSGGLLIPPGLCVGAFPPIDWAAVPESAKQQYKVLRLTLRTRWVGATSSDGNVGGLSFSTSGDTEHFALYRLNDGTRVTTSPIRVPPSGLTEDFAILTSVDFAAPSTIKAEFKWDADLTGSEHRVATDYVRLAPMKGWLTFIRQDPNNSKFPTHGDDACHMVSKAVTDHNLPPTADFDGPAGDSPDPDTFRVQVEDMASGLEQSIKVKLEVIRGSTTQYEHVFDVIEGSVNDAPVYRTNQFVRLVSNTVDGDFGAHRTPVVKLADYVRATLLLNDSPIGVHSLPVGRSPAEEGPKAIRTARAHFVTIADCASTPEEAIEQINRNWAQLAIRCRLESEETVASVNNALTIMIDNDAGKAENAGTLSVTVKNPATGDTKPVTVDFGVGDDATTMAKSLVEAIRGGPFTAWYYAHADEHFRGEIVIVNHKQDVTFDPAPTSTDPQVEFVSHPVNPTLPSSELGLAIISLNFRKDFATIVNIFALPTLHPMFPDQGVAGSYLNAEVSPGWTNVIFLGRDAAAPTDTRCPFVIGHEMGHIFGLDHHEDQHNLMIAHVSNNDSTGATKRLDAPGVFNQNTAVRAFGGIDQSGLLFPE